MSLAATAAVAAASSKEIGRVGQVSTVDNASPLLKMARAAGNFAKDSLTTILFPNPVNILIPGGGPAIVATTRGLQAAGEGVKKTGQGVADAAGSAGAGIKKGFTIATVLIVGALAFIIWHELR